MANRSYLLAVLALVAVVAVGCGGSDGEGGGSDERSARDIQPEAQQRAESIVLELSDFPDGWRASPAEGDEEGAEEFRRCIGGDFSKFTINGEAESQDFAMGETAEAASSATVFATDQDAQDATGEVTQGLTSSTVEDCVTDLFTKFAKKESGDIKVGDVDVGELSFTPPEIEEAKAFEIAVPVEAEGLEATAYIDFTFLRESNAVAIVFTLDVLDRFDPELLKDLLEALAGRMSGAPS